MVDVPTKEDFDALAMKVVTLDIRIAKIEALIETLKATIDSLYALLHPT